MARTKAEQAAIIRDGDTCLRCGRNLQGILASVHHRLPRSAGTKAEVDVPSNLVVVCGSGSSPGCHSWIHQHPAKAYETGWTLHRSDSDLAESIPLVDLLGYTFFLTEDGGILYVETF